MGPEDGYEPCPFCGSLALIPGYYAVSVRCKSCWAWGPLPTGLCESFPERARIAWNGRVALARDYGDGEVKPCPFCGGSPLLATSVVRGRRMVRIQCADCHAHGRTAYAGGFEVFLMLASEWNRRTSDPGEASE